MQIYEIDYFEAVGPRAYMEDSHYINTNCDSKGSIFVGVYDGHSGPASKEAALNLHKHFFKEWRVLGGKYTALQAMRKAYRRVSESIGKCDGGTTAANLLLIKNTAHVANSGDSKILLCGEREVKELTCEHKPDNPREKARIVKTGTQVIGGRIDGGINISRTLGDYEYQRMGLIYMPHLRKYKITRADRFLVIATDGLFHDLSNNDVFKTIRSCNSAREATAALKLAIRKVGLRDNITVVVINLNTAS